MALTLDYIVIPFQHTKLRIMYIMLNKVFIDIRLFVFRLRNHLRNSVEMRYSIDAVAVTHTTGL